MNKPESPVHGAVIHPPVVKHQEPHPSLLGDLSHVGVKVAEAIASQDHETIQQPLSLPDGWTGAGVAYQAYYTACGGVSPETGVMLPATESLTPASLQVWQTVYTSCTSYR